MRTIETEKRTIGVNFEKGMGRIKVWAPEATRLEVHLTEKEKKITLEPGLLGYHEATSSLIQPGDLYTLSVNGKGTFPDPASLSQPLGVHGASRAFDLSAHRPQALNSLKLEEYIIYEIHTGTFSPERNFLGIIQKLDYLADLGINAIELMPVAQFPGNRNWGYDGVHPFAVHSAYGGAKGLRDLVEACHQKGIAVILDVVLNHLGPEGNYLPRFGPYFTEKYKTPWGKAINFDDAWCDGVREYFIENVLMWFRDFGIDALRLDAVHAIKDFSPKHILAEISENAERLGKLTGNTHYLIAECDLNDTRYICSLEKRGYGMHAQWIDEFHHALRVAAGGERTGYYQDFNGIEHLGKAFEKAYVFDGTFSPHRKKIFGTDASDHPGHQFVVFSQNHDQVGNRMLGERTSELHSFDMQKLLAGAVMSSPFIPLLFMGEEYGETNPFLYFVSHGDAGLVEAVRKGRKAEFAEFHARGEAPDPQSEDTFNRSMLDWEKPAKSEHQVLLEFYRQLISLRKEHPVLKSLDRKYLKAVPDIENHTLVVHRQTGKHHLMAFFNFSGKTQFVTIPNPAGSLKKLIHSGDAQWRGAAEGPETVKGGSEFLIPPESFSLYASDE